jgi:hypothetical protein
MKVECASLVRLVVIANDHMGKVESAPGPIETRGFYSPIKKEEKRKRAKSLSYCSGCVTFNLIKGYKRRLIPPVATIISTKS